MVARARSSTVRSATARELAGELGLAARAVLGALLALEGDGAILRGTFDARRRAARRSAAVREALAAADDTDVPTSSGATAACSRASIG